MATSSARSCSHDDADIGPRSAVSTPILAAEFTGDEPREIRRGEQAAPTPRISQSSIDGNIAKRELSPAFDDEGREIQKSAATSLRPIRARDRSDGCVREER
jgi:hypothetical protein